MSPASGVANLELSFRYLTRLRCQARVRVEVPAKKSASTPASRKLDASQSGREPLPITALARSSEVLSWTSFAFALCRRSSLPAIAQRCTRPCAPQQGIVLTRFRRPLPTDYRPRSSPGEELPSCSASKQPGR